MLIVTGGFTATPETLDALRSEAIAHSVRSRGEDGCISHHVHADCENPLRLFFFERWRDADALKRHFAVPASGDFVRRLRAEAAQIEEIAIYEAAETRP